MKSSSKDNQYSNISKDLNRKRVHQFNGHGTLLKKPNIDNTIASVENLTEQRKNLPIYYGRKELIKVVIQHDTVILMSETGSGKTTQLPQYLLEAQLARFGVIVCTQPRRVAAITVADRVAKEKNTTLGDLVGYTVRFEDVTGPRTLLKYVTDGMLLRESLLDSLLKKYSVIILDEAHERSVQTDVLFGIVKHAQAKRKEMNMNKLKIVIMSATLQADNFVKYFVGAQVCYVEGRRHPIKIFYTEEIQKDYVHASLIAAIQVHKENPLGEDILVFLTGQEEIEILTNLIKEIEMFLPQTFGKILVCPLFASLPNNEQIKAFANAPPGYRKIILATNIAETSVTIPGIKHVVDCGMVKAKTHNPSTGLDILKVQPISKAQARQRSGRAGRECAGICYRLYPEKTFDALDEDTVPEIKRCNLRGVLLQLLTLGLKDILKFDFMDSPPQGAIEYALKHLVMLGAVESLDTQKITEKGKTMCSFPLDPPLAACILAAHDHGCTEELITIVALMSVESVFYIPPNQRERSKKVHAKFTSTEGDHISLLLFFRAYKHAKGNIQWCMEHFVNIKAIKNVLQIRHQLRELCGRLNINIKSCGTDYTTVRKVLASALCNKMSFNKNECLTWEKDDWDSPEKTIAGLKSLIEAVEDFPIKGILFRDIMSIFRVPFAVSSMIDMIAAYIEVHYTDVDAIIGLDARGFLFGPMIALNLEKPFIPIRKKGKLPGKCISMESTKEYGQDVLEIQCSGISDGLKVVIVDDLLATGGTMASSCALVRKAGGNVLACLVLVELVSLKGREKIDCPLCSFITYD